MRTRKLSIKKVKLALEETGGMPTYVAKVLGVTYSTIWNFMQKHPELKEVRESARSKLHEELESLVTFGIKTGYIQKAVLDKDGKPTSETIYEEVDVRTRLDKAVAIMSQYRASAGIIDKSNLDLTSKGEKIEYKGITVIELPENFKPKEKAEKETIQP